MNKMRGRGVALRNLLRKGVQRLRVGEIDVVGADRAGPAAAKRGKAGKIARALRDYGIALPVHPLDECSAHIAGRACDQIYCHVFLPSGRKPPAPSGSAPPWLRRGESRFRPKKAA